MSMKMCMEHIFPNRNDIILLLIKNYITLIVLLKFLNVMYIIQFSICSQILEVLARIRYEEEEYLCNQIYKNTMKLFFPYEL